MREAVSQIQWRAVASKGGLQLGVVRGGPGGLGSVIASPEAPDLIDGVQIAALRLHPDDRGFFEEIFRWGQGPAKDFAPSGSLQVSAALSYPGTIKAIHYHLRQTDLWAPVLGLFQVMLYDLRADSATFGRLNTLYVGTLRPWQIRIPPGVGHGYKVIGTESALLVYATDQWYDPTDEGRLPWNDPDVNYDWETQRR
ncbi:MAG: dTDP-4-dehydrorhamnose 3,5-epimerase family protein [Acidobacteria bacterium]|nr:dTDP-4-dehydrorhamnose 3,5-epimerase family protein [Acidobacteriota bacterium]